MPGRVVFVALKNICKYIFLFVNLILFVSFIFFCETLYIYLRILIYLFVNFIYFCESLYIYLWITIYLFGIMQQFYPHIGHHEIKL